MIINSPSSVLVLTCLAAGGKPTAHMHGTLQLRVYRIIENRTTLKLRWQDGTETEELSVGFVPYRNVDE
jgi:hypothetical protein